MAIDYTTTQKVADYLNVDVSTIKQDWIDWSTAYINTFTCQIFCPTVTTEKYDIESEQDVLQLDNYPIITLTELKDDGNIVDLADLLVYEDEGFIKIKEEFAGINTLIDPGPFTPGRQKVEVTYTFGYASVPKEIEWAATVLSASIASTALKQSGTLSVGDVIEEEIGEFRRRKAEQSSGDINFDISIEKSKIVNDRLEEDVFSAKNVLRMYRDRKMRSV